MHRPGRLMQATYGPPSPARAAAARDLPGRLEVPLMHCKIAWVLAVQEEALRRYSALLRPSQDTSQVSRGDEELAP